MKSAWNGKDDLKIFHRQEVFTLFLDPLSLLEALAFRAVSISARVVHILRMTAMIALMDMSTENRSTADDDIPYCLCLFG
jgi:hypothetical protein